jgi:colicin import membrane protein
VVRKRRRTSPGTLKAIAYAVLLHLVVLTVLFVSWRFAARDRPASDKIMQAVVVNDGPRAKDEPPPDKRPAEDAARKTEEEKRRQAEVRKQQEEAKRKEAERKRKEEAEKKKKAEAEKQLREAEKKRQAAERQKQAETALKEQLAQEERSREEAARAARAAAEADKHKAVIRQKVSRNWNRPAGSRPGLECTVRVRLVPGGEVLEAAVVRSSGDALFDRSVENAVYKASPLPLPQNPELFEYFRVIEFVFRPEE